MAIESHLRAVSTLPPAEELLLKVASCYVELYENRNDLDTESTLVCTEEELLVLRESVPPNIRFNNVPVTPKLKRKILEGIVYLNSAIPEELTISNETGPTKYDVAEKIIEWKRRNP